MPSKRTVLRWLASKDREGFCHQYARAREFQADLLAEQILEIADDGSNDTYVDDEGNVRVDYDHIQRSRLRVDARKWLASKMAPKKYGDRIETTHTGPNGNPIQARIAVEFVKPNPTSQGNDDE